MSINKILDKDIEQIKRLIYEMIYETKLQYASTFEVVQTDDLELAQKTIANDQKINDMLNAFTHIALWKIVKQRMVARDLRRTIGSISIAREIEIIADYAKNICKYFVKYTPSKEDIEAITVMFTMVIKMLDLVSSLADSFGADQKNAVLEMEKELKSKFDEFNLGLFYKIRNAKTDEQALVYFEQIRELKNLQRAADHLINIQEILTFIRTGSFEELQNAAKVSEEDEDKEDL
ncbi:PhoU domain-containing protein [Williamsoniiplasma lucivorax]|uniref:Phosphate transport system regulator PhoU n=1 Tax=Williamsoniiplasma lucivorax TaxID=209274 RepID=A0A2S5R9U7_9MOLU|nr:PhoU domain-containing protein [Williamsoniiplasma lucivorax]PPE04070.1 phosphate transport system regulator PhoU [Williamsoniiplasma lucivorax]